MKIFKKICAVLLVVALVIGYYPPTAFAIDDSITDTTTYSIANDYIKYTINAKTGGYCIETLEGHPQKSLDNNIPLLYKDDDEQSNGTSFTTVRINGKDYVFGQDYSWFGIPTSLSRPVISEEGRLITISWIIAGYVVSQRVAISADENNSLCGNVGISYEIQNNNKNAGIVGVRVMMDAALDNVVDAPYVVADSSISPTIVETEYSKTLGNMPQQIRFTNSVTSPTKMAYALLSGWSGLTEVLPDKVIVGHWANLANSRYNYTPDESCDFSNYSNKYRTADTAAAYYWSEQTLESGAVRTAEMIYGIGNFSSELSNERLGVDMTIGSVHTDATGDAYVNGGEFDVTVSLDNSVDTARTLISPVVILTVGEGLIFKETGTKEYRVTYEGGIDIGSIKTIQTTIIASPQYEITSKRIVAAVTATEYVDEQTNNLVEYSASRNVLLPSVGGILPDIQMNQVSPETVYFEGEKNITVSGNMSAFSSLAGSVGWDLYLVSQATKEEVKIDKKNICFTDDSYKSMSFSTEEELTIGVYNIVFKFTNEQLKATFGSRITAAATLNVSADPSFLCKSYGLVAMVRFGDTNKYDFFSFTNEEALNRFVNGETLGQGLSNLNITFNGETDEVLAVVRGKIREMTDEYGTYFQANTTDSDVTINNMMAYCGDTPLYMTTTEEGARISGDGTIKVISSINIWHNAWSISGQNGNKQTLDQDAISENSGSELEISLDGAGSMLQYIGGFLIDLKFGVLTKADDLCGVSFGGTITLPISSASDDAAFGAEISSILYGERSDESVGFVGIDATFSIALPSDLLGSLVQNAPGVEAEVTINTINNYYRLEFGVELVMFECEGIIAFKQVPIKSIDRIVPDELYFQLSGDIMQIPIVPPFVFMTGIGGGISNLADTMSDELTGLPPLTLKLYTQLLLVETLVGDFTLEINLSGMALEGELKLQGDDDGKIMKITGGLNCHWVSPFSLNVYGNISVYAGMIKGGVTITISDDYFYGYIYASFCIPDPIPIIGGKEIGRIEAAVSSDFIGANIKIIGIKFGFIYYWDGDFHFGGGIDLSSRGDAVTLYDSYYTDENGQAVEYSALFGTNMTRLASTMVGSTKGSGLASVVKNFDPTLEDALLLEVPYTGDVTPILEEITLANPEGTNIPLVLGDEEGNGNCIIQDRGEAGKYIYITITDPTLLIAGNWSLTITTDGLTVSDFAVDGVDNLPELTDVTFSHSADNSKELTVNWVTDCDSDVSGTLDIYLAKDADTLSQLQTSNTTENNSVDSIKRITLDNMASGSATIEIPDAYADGDYYVVAMLSQNEGGMSSVSSTDYFTFVNDSLPNEISGVSVGYAGNGDLDIDVTDSETVNYDYYLVSILDENKNAIENNYGKFAAGSDVIMGAAVGPTDNPGLVAGQIYYVSVQTLKETDDNYYYSTNTVVSEAYVMPEVSKPVLTSVTANIPDTIEYTNTTTYTATYTFDQPVALTMSIDDKDVAVGNAYQSEWTVNINLEDGAHFIDFKAVNAMGDSVSGNDFTSVANAQLGVNVDSQAPVLTLGEVAATSMDGEIPETSISNQTVFMNDLGEIVIKGLTEADITVTFDGSADNVIVNPDGTFVITKTMDVTKAYDQKVLKAVDKAGNETSLIITIVNSNLTKLTSISLSSDVMSLIDENSGIKYIEINVGDVVNLSTLANNGDIEFALGNDYIDWSVLYEQNLITFENGVITAKAPGETAIRANYRTATYDTEGMNSLSNENNPGTVSSGVSDVIIVRITGEVVVIPPTQMLKHNVIAQADEHGSINSDYLNQMVYDGTSTSIISVPEYGYEVEYIYINDVQYPGTREYTIPAVMNDMSIRVTFRKAFPLSLTSPQYNIDEGGKIICKISERVSVQDFVTNINEREFAKIYRGTEEVSATENIATGMTVRIVYEDQIVSEYTVIVAGDVDGDGRISINDSVLMQSNILGKTELEGAYASASNVDGDYRDGSINDLVVLNSYIIGKIETLPANGQGEV